jgi:TrmH family RNA methyltransferase
VEVASADRIRFVLVRPQHGGNVGSTARALKNLGYARLVIVRPECDPLGDEARMMAVDAADVLGAAAVVDDLDRALEGARTVVGTSCRTGRGRKPHYALDRVSSDLAGLAAAGDLAILFGREDRGLTDAELDRCTHLVYLPSSEVYPSFNVAQAALLVAWELRRAAAARPVDAEAPVRPAPHAEREAMYRHVQRALIAVGFLADDTAVSMMRRIRRMLGRAGLTSGEVKIVRGIARKILWAAGAAGLPLPPEDHGAAGEDR